MNFGRETDPNAKGAYNPQKTDIKPVETFKNAMNSKMNNLLHQYTLEKQRLAAEAKKRPKKETAMEKRIK